MAARGLARLGTGPAVTSDRRDSVAVYRETPRTLVFVFGLSVLVQLLRILQAYGLGLGLGLDVPFSYYLVFMPIGLLMLLLPISVSGFGLPQGVMVWLLRPLGVPDELALCPHDPHRPLRACSATSPERGCTCARGIIERRASSTPTPARALSVDQRSTPTRSRRSRRPPGRRQKRQLSDPRKAERDGPTLTSDHNRL